MQKRMKEPEWEELLSAASRMGNVVPEAVLVGGTSVALHVGHRMSFDADFVLGDLKEKFEAILEDLESAAGWHTDRVRKNKIVLGQFDGVDTCIRQLIRERPLETEEYVLKDGTSFLIPTRSECLRIKCALVLKRNAFRDYLDTAALLNAMPEAERLAVLESMDDYYPQSVQGNALLQLVAQFSDPQPYDLSEVAPDRYKGIRAPLNSWNTVKNILLENAWMITEKLSRHEQNVPCGEEPSP